MKQNTAQSHMYYFKFSRKLKGSSPTALQQNVSKSDDYLPVKNFTTCLRIIPWLVSLQRRAML